MKSELDHVLWGVADLDQGMSAFAKMTGVMPQVGGRHPGIGTRNALVSLGETIYFEIIAPDPAQHLQGTLGGELASLPAPTLMAMALRAPDLARIAAAYDAHGIASERLDEGRTTPQGERLSWSLCEPAYDLKPMDPRRPFYIDWKGTPHPSRSAPAGCRYKSITVSGPDAAETRKLWAELGVPAELKQADRHQIMLLLTTPQGEVRFDGRF